MNLYKSHLIKIILVAIWVINLKCIAQSNRKLDSLETVLLNCKEDTNKVSCYNEIIKINILTLRKLDVAQNYINKQLELCLKLNYKRGLGHYNHFQGNIYYYKFQYDDALKYYNKAIEIWTELNDYTRIASTTINIANISIYKGNYQDALKKYLAVIENEKKIKEPKVLGNVHGNIAAIYFNISDYKNGIKSLEKSITFFEQANSKKDIANSYQNISNIYGKIGDRVNSTNYAYKALSIRESIQDELGKIDSYIHFANEMLNQNKLNEALGYLDKALFVSTKISDKRQLAEIYHTYGNIYGKQKLFDKAFEYFIKELDTRVEIKDKSGTASSYIGLGQVFLDKDSNYTEAIKKFNEALNIYTELNNKSGIANSHFHIGTSNFRLKKYEDAEEHFQKSIAQYLKTGEKERIYLCYHFLYRINDIKGESQKALEYLKLRSNYKDSINNESIINETNKIALKHEFEKKEALAKIEFEKQQALSKVQLTEKQMLIEASKHELEILEKENLLKKYDIERANNNIRQKSFETEKQKTTITLLNKEAQLKNIEAKKKEEEIKKQQTLRYAFTIGFAVLLMLSLYIYRSLRLNKQKNLIISKQKEIIEEKQKETIDSINYAKRIQYALLANDQLLKNHLSEHFVLFAPKDIVSGDFYWATEHDGKFYLAVCDSTGHGVPGAFMSLLNMGFLSEAIKEKNITTPDKIFDYVRYRLINSIGSEGQRDGMDAILICMDKTTNRITYSAANNSPILIHNNQIKELTKDKMPVGKGEKEEGFNLFQIEASPGDTLYFYTDGYADQFGGEKGKKFKYKALNELLLSVNRLKMEQQKETLLDTFGKWKGNLEQVDDVCVIGIKI